MVLELGSGLWESRRMKTPVRNVRIEENLWKEAERVAEALAKETGLSATASDVVRKALTEYVERWKVSRRARKAEAQ
jgi:hypothetical protein